mmetsp:Transcript_41767/g.75829  ORF Transcript_41767/g.75829 Transcript_41767/m.75829 type:complete len:146 (-) Transcript_41767:32-469(-)
MDGVAASLAVCSPESASTREATSARSSPSTGKSPLASDTAVRGRQDGFKKAMDDIAWNSGLASQMSTCAPPSEDGACPQDALPTHREACTPRELHLQQEWIDSASRGCWKPADLALYHPNFNTRRMAARSGASAPPRSDGKVVHC